MGVVSLSLAVFLSGASKAGAFDLPGQEIPTFNGGGGRFLQPCVCAANTYPSYSVYYPYGVGSAGGYCQKTCLAVGQNFPAPFKCSIPPWPAISSSDVWTQDQLEDCEQNLQQELPYQIQTAANALTAIIASQPIGQNTYTLSGGGITITGSGNVQIITGTK